MAGSQFLYLLMQNIEPSLPVAAATCNMLNKGELKGEKRQSIGQDAEQRSGAFRRLPPLHPQEDLLKRHIRQAKPLQLNDSFFFFFTPADQVRHLRMSEEENIVMQTVCSSFLLDASLQKGILPGLLTEHYWDYTGELEHC